MIHRLDELAKAERESLLTDVGQHLEGLMAEETWQQALDVYLEISPPKIEDEFIPLKEGPGRQLSKIVLQDEFGLTGAVSRKPGNIRLNLGEAMENAVESGIVIIESASKPFILITVCLLACRKLYRATQITLKERHAMVIACLWKLKAPGSLTLPRMDLHQAVSELLTAANKGEEFTKDGFYSTLSDLDAIKAIRMEKDGTVSLIEEVVVEYGR